MRRREFLKGTAAAAGAVIAAPSISRAAKLEVSFYYPVAVGGPITKLIDAYARDFEKENPDIKQFYERLLRGLDLADGLRGDWHLCEVTGWQDNQSCENVLAWT